MLKLKVKKDASTTTASSSSSLKKRDRRSTDSKVEKVKKIDRKKVAPIVRCARSGKGNQNQPLPEELVFEVLSRIENIKTLHQCKCVSKAWRSIINHPRFIESFRRHHRGGMVLFIVEKGRSCWEPLKLYYSTISVKEAKPSVKEAEPFSLRLTVPRSILYQGITEVVKGLFCVYEQTRVFVYNICTGETLRLPDTDYPRVPCSYSLGYDTCSQVYKLLKVSSFGTAEEEHLGIQYCRLECDILTLGRDLSWRKVSTVNAPRIPKAGVGHVFDRACSLLIHGIMYWVIDDGFNQATLISFDLNKEEFRLLNPPQEPWSFLRGCDWTVAQFGGRPGMYYCGGGECDDLYYCGGDDYPKCLYLYRLEDDDDNGQADSWSKHAIPIPCGFDDLSSWRSWSTEVIGNLSTGETLFSDIVAAAVGNGEFALISSFDFQKNKFMELVVGNRGRLRESFGQVILGTHLEENLAPLDARLSGA